MNRGALQATVHGVAEELDLTSQLNNKNISLMLVWNMNAEILFEKGDHEPTS